MTSKKMITVQRVRKFVKEQKKHQYVYLQTVYKYCGGISPNESIRQYVQEELKSLCKEKILEEIPQYKCPRCAQLFTLEFLQKLDKKTLQCTSCGYVFSEKDARLLSGIYRKK